MSTIEKDRFEGLKGELTYIPDTDEYLGKIKEKTGTEFNLEDFERSQIPFMDRLKKVYIIQFLSSIVCMYRNCLAYIQAKA